MRSSNSSKLIRSASKSAWSSSTIFSRTSRWQFALGAQRLVRRRFLLRGSRRDAHSGDLAWPRPWPSCHGHAAAWRSSFGWHPWHTSLRSSLIQISNPTRLTVGGADGGSALRGAAPIDPMHQTTAWAASAHVIVANGPSSHPVRGRGRYGPSARVTASKERRTWLLDWISSSIDPTCTTRPWSRPTCPIDSVPQSGEALLRVDCFGLSANNITYAALGDSMRYWEFFPARDGYGRVPVWGFADVVASAAHGVETGRRYLRVLPAVDPRPGTTRATCRPAASSTRARIDPALPAVYNRYVDTAADAAYDARHEGLIALLRPLYADRIPARRLLRRQRALRSRRRGRHQRVVQDGVHVRGPDATSEPTDRHSSASRRHRTSASSRISEPTIGSSTTAPSRPCRGRPRRSSTSPETRP